MHAPAEGKQEEDKEDIEEQRLRDAVARPSTFAIHAEFMEAQARHALCMPVRHKRAMFALMRAQPPVEPHSFFPKHGATVGELATLHVLVPSSTAALASKRLTTASPVAAPATPEAVLAERRMEEERRKEQARLRERERQRNRVRVRHRGKAASVSTSTTASAPASVSTSTTAACTVTPATTGGNLPTATPTPTPTVAARTRPVTRAQLKIKPL